MVEFDFCKMTDHEITTFVVEHYDEFGEHQPPSYDRILSFERPIFVRRPYGFAIYRRSVWPKDAVLSYLFVKPNFRRSGTSRLFVHEVLAEIGEPCVLMCYSAFRRDFFVKCGFKPREHDAVDGSFVMFYDPTSG